MELLSGKFNISIGAQWGSEGKALLNQYLDLTNHIDVSVNNCSSNAGHSFILHGKKHIAKFLPVTGILSKRNQIYLCADAIIHPKTLLDEIAYFDIDPERVAIHPRCAIIEDFDIQSEADPASSVTKIASTQSGGGSALARKIMRSARLAQDVPELKRMVNKLDLHYYMDQGCTVLMEVPQGFELSLNSEHYPHVTSRNIDVSSAMSAAQVHPSYLGKVCVVIRTLPIRVGHIFNEDGGIIGNSGPVYDDMVELSWEELGIEPELTTVTKRQRRIFSFSMEQYKHMLSVIRPDYIMLNFTNYLSREQYMVLLEGLDEVTHLGFGPKVDQVFLNHVHG
jgi:adenylosuccinate synthase